MMIDRIVFVHGWSVYNTETYGELPQRLAAEIPGLQTHHLRLAKYISFRDEVRMTDVARAMEAAVQSELDPASGQTFAVITHSTGGPVVRTWWRRFYVQTGRVCPMTHAIHLAAAHFGSALAQLGKGKLGRLKSFVESIEPGEGILDWLELGSAESLKLNREWVGMKPTSAWPNPVFQFCLVGQQIDRKFYDNLNSYTGEMGSDGTVRVAAANLNTSFLRLVQRPPTSAQLDKGKPSVLEFDPQGIVRSQDVAFSLVPETSHVGERLGIMRSVKKSGGAPPVVQRIKEALQVADEPGYQTVVQKFQAETRRIHEAEVVEVENRIFADRIFFHDPCAMVIIKVRDEEGKVPGSFRIIFTGAGNDPNGLPEGFLLDRQQNSKDRGVVTFFFNCGVMLGSPALYSERPGKPRKKVRPALPALSEFGIRVEGDPLDGFAHYHPTEAKASPDLLQKILRPDETTVIEIVLKRIVREKTFSFAAGLAAEDYRKTPPGKAIPI